MPIKYKLDVMDALKKVGYSSTRLRNEKLMGESYMQQLRRGELVSWKTIETICHLLKCQPGDLLEYEEAVRDLDSIISTAETYAASHSGHDEDTGVRYAEEGRSR